jgi:hypothetical protein
MTYRILYTDHGDVVATYESLEEAQAELDSFVREHPELVPEIGIMAFDDSGRATGDFVPASDSGLQSRAFA